jgi:type I restriction enzyme S subunit
MAEWRETTLGEVCDEVEGIIQTGPFGSQLHESDYSAEGIPVVMPKDIIEGRISTESVARISIQHVDRLKRHKLDVGDIVYGRRGDIGRQALIRKSEQGWLCGTGCLRVSLGSEVLVPLFLHYYLRQVAVIRWISNQAVGATLPNLNTGILRSVPVTFPPIPEQKRIAGILSAYDELIENSQRRIKVLESMARNLYREWFVHYRFPGHENTPLIPSPLGNIPKGWELKKLEQMAEIKGGKQLEKDKIFEEGEFPVFGGNGIQGYAKRATHEGFVIAFGRVGAYCGSIHWSYGGAWLNNNSSSVVPFNFDELVLHHLLDYSFTNLRGGAAQPFISNSALAGIQLLFPGEKIAEKFSALIKPIRLQQVFLEKSVQNLRKTRDLLLSRLLSGQIPLHIPATQAA